VREGNCRVKSNAVIATSLNTVGYIWASEKKSTTKKKRHKNILKSEKAKILAVK